MLNALNFQIYIIFILGSILVISRIMIKTSQHVIFIYISTMYIVKQVTVAFHKHFLRERMVKIF